jgi:hypothetical protein
MKKGGFRVPDSWFHVRPWRLRTAGIPGSGGHVPANPEPLNPEPLNPEPLNPEPLNPEPRAHEVPRAANSEPLRTRNPSDARSEARAERTRNENPEP